MKENLAASGRKHPDVLVIDSKHAEWFDSIGEYGFNEGKAIRHF